MPIQALISEQTTKPLGLRTQGQSIEAGPCQGTELDKAAKIVSVPPPFLELADRLKQAVGGRRALCR